MRKFASLLLFCAAAAAMATSAEPEPPEIDFYDLRKNPNYYCGRDIRFSLDLEQGIPAGADEELKARFGEAKYVWLSSMSPWVIGPREELVLDLGRLRNGQKVFVFGRMERMVLDREGDRYFYVVMARRAVPYARLLPHAGVPYLAAYQDARMYEIYLRFKEFDGRSVHLAVKMRRMDPIDAGLALRLGVNASDWLVVSPEGPASQVTNLYVPLAQKEAVDFLMARWPGDLFHVYGRVTKIPYSARKNRAGLVVDLVSGEPFVIEPSSTGEPILPPEASAEEAPAVLPLEPGALAQAPAKYCGRTIRIRLPYGGDEYIPEGLSEAVALLQGRLWTKLLTGNALPGSLCILLDRSQKLLTDQVERSILNDPMLLTGVLYKVPAEDGTDTFYLLLDEIAVEKPGPGEAVPEPVQPGEASP
ncbi:MAG: hypothetical protein V1918_03690 [Planctomycetota bacterium]